MTNEELKARLQNRIPEPEILDKIVVLEGDEFADGAIGLTDDFKIVYSYERLVQSLSRAYGEKEEQSVEYLDYNTLRMIPYWKNQGLLAPIIVHEF